MNDLYYETYNEGPAPEEDKGGLSRILGIVWKTVVVVVVAAVFFIIFYRIFEMNEPSGVGKLLFTGDSLALYDTLGDRSVVRPEYDRSEYAYEKESLTSVYLTKKGESADDYEKITLTPDEYYETKGFRVFEANVGSYTVRDDKGDGRLVKISGFYEVAGSPVEGALRATHVYLIPAARQVQFTFRCKNNALEKLEGHTAPDGSVFRIVLRDGKGRTYESYSYKTDSKGVYRYTTMLFEDVSLDDVEHLALDLHYIDRDYADAVLTIDLYDGGLPLPLLNVGVVRAEPEELKKYEG